MQPPRGTSQTESPLYLPFLDVPITTGGVDEAFQTIESDVRRWRRLRTTQVPNLAAPEAYPKCLDRCACRWCNFAPVCQACDPDGPIDSSKAHTSGGGKQVQMEG